LDRGRHLRVGAVRDRLLLAYDSSIEPSPPLH
jgi:hypothetical protein